MDPKESSTEKFLIEQARLVISRLERISADSVWAHRSSGLRGGLLRWVDELETGPVLKPAFSQLQRELKPLERLIHQGFEMLEGAAREKSGGDRGA